MCTCSKLCVHSEIFKPDSLCGWNIDGFTFVWVISICACMRAYTQTHTHTKQKQIQDTNCKQVPGFNPLTRKGQ